MDFVIKNRRAHVPKVGVGVGAIREGRPITKTDFQTGGLLERWVKLIEVKFYEPSCPLLPELIPVFVA